jgi:radical SAM protein with 4Fe4S-binding SPASM domain
MRNALHIADAAAAKYQFPISCSIPIQPCIINTSSFAHLRFGYCAAGTDNAYYTLDPLGNLRPCNHTTTVLGNLLDKPFSELTAPERMASFTAATPDFCAPCKMRQSCQGGCKAAAQVCYGSLSAEEPFLHLNRNRAKPILK